MAYTVLNKHDFEQELEAAGNNLVVVDFFANWCGPCKIVNPYLQELSIQYADKAKFLKVNVDDCEDIAMAYNVTSMPTFVFIKDQQIIDVLVGSNTDKLEKNIQKHVSDKSAIVQKLKDPMQDVPITQDIDPDLEDDSAEDDLLEDPTSMLEVIVDDQI